MRNIKQLSHQARHRPARASDLPRLVEIYNQVICEGGFTGDLTPYTLEQRRSWFDTHQQTPFLIHVVESGDRVVGYFYFSPWRSGRAAMRQVAEVSYYLEKSARGQGLGRFMLTEAERLARDAGLRDLLAILLEINTGSRVLLEKHGFQLAGNLPGIADLGDRRCGQLIMHKCLEGNAE